MEFVRFVRSFLADGRFDANLIAVYGLMVVLVLSSLLVRRLLARGGWHLARWTGIDAVERLGHEVSQRARRHLFWFTAVCMSIIALGGVAYHFAGRDIRDDLGARLAGMTLGDFLQTGAVLAGLAGLAGGAWFTAAVIQRARPWVETHVAHWVGRGGNRETLHRWFSMLELYSISAARLLAVWGAGHLVGLGDLATATVGFVFRVVSVVAVSRLLTLGFRTLTHTVADLGNRHLGHGHLRHYWDRVTRLFPFGERCFEAAVWVSAASLCVAAFSFIEYVAHLGPAVVKCIGILFASRMLIELLQVLLNEAFGLYSEHHRPDQKGLTLVPLIHSVCQYVIYFGAGILMLDELGVKTTPILAGAGVIGLAVGLGAQSLVTDVVSGFFILFEGQYLVGDFVQVGEAVGIVEAVGIRLTQIRDGQGKLYIIPNGQIKGVVSYSKGYVNAVVDMRFPSGSDLEGVLRKMAEAGRRLRQAHPEVLGDTEIQGLVDLGTSDMTVRAVTRVQPGSHLAMQNAFRRHLKEVFDEQKAGPTSLAA